MTQLVVDSTGHRVAEMFVARLVSFMKAFMKAGFAAHSVAPLARAFQAGVSVALQPVKDTRTMNNTWADLFFGENGVLRWKATKGLSSLVFFWHVKTRCTRVIE